MILGSCRYQGRIQPEVEEGGGNFWRGRENFWDVGRGNSLAFLLNNSLVYMFPCIQNETLKKECILVRIRDAVLAQKRAPKLSFHREGGSCPHLPPIRQMHFTNIT